MAYDTPTDIRRDAAGLLADAFDMEHGTRFFRCPSTVASMRLQAQQLRTRAAELERLADYRDTAPTSGWGSDRELTAMRTHTATGAPH